jgi:multicomponent Na+:H+ antiporter subunit B
LKFIPVILVLSYAALLIFASTGLPLRGDPSAPPNVDISRAGSPVSSSYYIRHAYDDAQTPNIVTVVLADYRGFDTLGEVLVVITAGLCCVLILRKREP